MILNDVSHLVEATSFIRWVSSRSYSFIISDKGNRNCAKDLSKASIFNSTIESKLIPVFNRFDYNSTILGNKISQTMFAVSYADQYDHFKVIWWLFHYRSFMPNRHRNQQAFRVLLISVINTISNKVEKYSSPYLVSTMFWFQNKNYFGMNSSPQFPTWRSDHGHIFWWCRILSRTDCIVWFFE
jgi:hypothetical protein